MEGKAFSAPGKAATMVNLPHRYRKLGQGEGKMLLQMTERQGRRMLTDPMKRNSKRVDENGAVKGDDA